MSRSASTAPAAPTSTMIARATPETTPPDNTTPKYQDTQSANKATTTTTKSTIMDKFFNIANPSAAAAMVQSAHGFAQQHADETNPYILPSFADNYEAWAFPETQQAIFEDWISASATPSFSTATPPPTAVASPTLSRALSSNSGSALLGVSPAAFSNASPTMTPPSGAISPSANSPLLSSDLALNLASTLQSASASGTAPSSLTVADYAAVLFPDIAATISAIGSPIDAASNVTCAMATVPVSEQNPLATTPSSGLSPAAEPPLTWTANLSAIFDSSLTAPSDKSAPSAAAAAAAAAESQAAASSAAAGFVFGSSDPNAEQSRKRRDTEFLASLPPQLALKRRRTSNTKQKEKILAEIFSSTTAAEESAADAAPSAAPAPVPAKKAAGPKKAAGGTKAKSVAASKEAVEEDLDAIALKRKKNTDAARRSRMRKILRIETLEGRVSELESENNKLSAQVATLEAEKEASAKREKELADMVKQYEARLVAVAAAASRSPLSL